MRVDNRAVGRQRNRTESANSSVRWRSGQVQCTCVARCRCWTWILWVHFTG